MQEKPNLSYVDQLSGDDTEFKNSFISIIKQEFPKEKELYMDCVDRQLTKQTADIVHKIKHKFSILSMQDSYRLAVAYEMELLEGRTTSESEFKSVLNIMENYLKTI
ncbi:histidine kinase [Maribacter sp. 4G9]|uniref:histidine kinase n=1 Tax=Maribacter sp. 4G9 TaxID=1889777 RepID=UPI000C14D321|nr:histidine kinase [Maribacter sp. 4G9]PIB28848.1 histidine kinase [Maribacter sp. 4G9]